MHIELKRLWKAIEVDDATRALAIVREAVQKQKDGAASLVIDDLESVIVDQISRWPREFSRSEAFLAELGGGALELLPINTRLKPVLAAFYFRVAHLLQSSGRMKEAVERYRLYLALNQYDCSAYNNLGICHVILNEPEKARVAFEKGLELDPAYAEIHNNLALLEGMQGNHSEALRLLARSVTLEPDYLDARINLGDLFLRLGRLKLAEAEFEEAIRIDKRSFSGYFGLASVFFDQGENEDAKKYYELALQIDQGNAMAHRSLSLCKKYDQEDEQISAVRALIKDPAINDSDKSQLFFVLAKAFSDQKKYSQCFEMLKSGNQIRKKISGYDSKLDSDKFNQLTETMRKLDLVAPPDFPSQIPFHPIFIVGMPRSGTSLVEQILASHSLVAGAGELTYLVDHGGDYALGKSEPSTQSLANLVDKYLGSLSIHFEEGAKYITDKYPLNFQNIPLILAALPEARIIHCYRNPSATCWSLFRTYFHYGMDFSNDEEDIKRFYNRYREFMNGVDRTYAGRVFHLDYERLTVVPEPIIRELLGYLELPWEHACLRPDLNKRSVRTASSMQVRSRIYQGSRKEVEAYKGFFPKGAFDLVPFTPSSKLS